VREQTETMTNFAITKTDGRLAVKDPAADATSLLFFVAGSSLTVGRRKNNAKFFVVHGLPN
jgi:hypothetical protein